MSTGRNPVESIANKGLYGCTLKAVMDFNLRSQVVFIRCAHKFIPSKNVQDEKDEALTTTSSKGRIIVIQSMLITQGVVAKYTLPESTSLWL